MSGLEVLGALAAAAQLCGYVQQIVESLWELHDHIRHGSSRIQSYVDQVQLLTSTIQSIQDNKDFHTVTVHTILKAILTKVDGLNKLIKKSQSRVARPTPKRYVTIFTERKTEKRVKEELASLESDKANLLICISWSTRTTMADFRDESTRGISRAPTYSTDVEPTASNERTERGYPSTQDGFVANTAKARMIPRNDEKAMEQTESSNNTSTSVSFAASFHSGQAGGTSNDPWRFENNKVNRNVVGMIGTTETALTKGHYLNNDASSNYVAMIGKNRDQIEILKMVLDAAPKLPCPYAPAPTGQSGIQSQ